MSILKEAPRKHIIFMMPTLSRVLTYTAYKTPMFQAQWIVGFISFEEQLILVMAVRKAELEGAPALSQAHFIKPSQWLEDTAALSGFAKKKNQSSERGCDFPKAVYLAGKKGHLVQVGICPLVNSGISNDSPFHFDGGHFRVGAVKREKEGMERVKPQKALWPISCFALQWPWSWKGQRSRLPWCFLMSQGERQLSGTAGLSPAAGPGR